MALGAAGARPPRSGMVLGLGTEWGWPRYWWVWIMGDSGGPAGLADFLVVAPSAHEPRGVTTGRLLDPAIAHCVVLAL